MPINREVEVCGYSEVSIKNEDLIQELDKKDAIEVIDGLLNKFPDLADIILKHTKEETKLFPKGLREGLIDKYKKENKSLLNFKRCNQI